MKQNTRHAASGAAGTVAHRDEAASGVDSSVRAIPGLPPGGFATILADPPWQAQSGEAHYQTMSLERIMGMPVVELAAADAHLWLWTTNALLPRAY